MPDLKTTGGTDRGSISAELRQAADKLEAAQGSACCHADDATESRSQFAGLLRTIAHINEQDPAWSSRHPVALDMARQINRSEVSA